MRGCADGREYRPVGGSGKKSVKFSFKNKSLAHSGWVGVCLDPARLRLVRVRWNGTDKPRVRAMLDLERSADLIEDLRRLRKERGVPLARLALVLAPGQYQSFQIEAPEVPSSELNAAIRWRVKDMLAQPLERSVVDALLLPAPSSAARSRQALVVAADRQVVEALAQPFVDAGFKPAAVDVPELAQRNLAALCEDENRGLAFLHLGPDSGLLTLTWHGELFACRRLEMGSTVWTEGPDFDGERQRMAFERITLELQRTLDNFERQFSFISVNRLVLAGDADLSPLAEHLRPNLYMPVVLFDAAQVLDLPPGTTQVPAQWLPALGLALRADGPTGGTAS